MKWHLNTRYKIIFLYDYQISHILDVMHPVAHDHVGL